MTATYDFSQTRNQIIHRALRLCGVVAQGNTPTGEQMAEGSQALESLVKYLQADNVFLWTIEDRDYTLIAGQKDYTHVVGDSTSFDGRDVLMFWHAWVTDAAGKAYRIGIVDENTFISVNNPDFQGIPEMMMYEMREVPILRFYPVPNLAYSLHYKVVRKMRDFDTALGTPEMPQRWFDPLCYLLAANLADEYQLALDKCNYLRSKAAEMREKASQRDDDPVDTVYMNPV